MFLTEDGIIKVTEFAEYIYQNLDKKQIAYLASVLFISIPNNKYKEVLELGKNFADFVDYFNKNQ